MTIGARIATSKAIAAGLLILLGLLVYLSNIRMSSLLNDGLARLSRVSRLDDQIEEIQTRYRRSVRALKGAEFRRAEELTALSEDLLREKFEEVRQELSGLPAAAPILAEFEPNYSALQTSHEQLIVAFQSGNEAHILRAFQNWQNAQGNNELVMKDLVAMAKIDLQLQYQSMVRSHRNIHLWILVLVLLSLAHVLFSLRHFLQTIVSPLKYLSVKSAQFAAGQRDLIEKVDASDEIGQLSKNMRRMQESVVQTENRLQTSNHRLERFAAVAAHDLRSPLSSGLMFLNRACETQNLADDDDLVRAQSVFSRSLETIESLLSLADSGIAISKANLDCQQVLDEVCEDLDREIQAAHATVERASLDRIRANPGLVRELLRNLVANSIKYRDRGRSLLITISVEEQIQDGKLYQCLLVADNGIGFDSAKVDKLLKPFSRGEKGRIAGIEGAGLGLTICSEIMMRHSGHFQLKSKLNQGTIAKAFFPVECEPPIVVTQTPELEVDGSALKGKSILLADDDLLVRELIAEHLMDFGLVVTQCSGAREAIDKIHADPPDLVLTDFRMPGGDGDELLAWVNLKKKGIPVVLLSADCREGNRQSFVEQGFADCIQKGATSTMLFRAVSKHLSGA